MRRNGYESMTIDGGEYLPIIVLVYFAARVSGDQANTQGPVSRKQDKLEVGKEWKLSIGHDNSVEPNKDEPHYVVPAVVLPDGTYIMGSPKIAEVLNKLHPEPQVILDPHGYTEFIAFVRAVMDALEPVYFTAVPWRLLNEASVPYFESTREKDAGMPLEKFWKERGGDICWTQAEPPLRGVTALLKENQGGPFFLGEAVSIADFVWAGLLIWFRRMGEDDYFQEILKRSGDGQVHLDILKAVEPWCKKID